MGDRCIGFAAPGDTCNKCDWFTKHLGWVTFVLLTITAVLGALNMFNVFQFQANTVSVFGWVTVGMGALSWVVGSIAIVGHNNVNHSLNGSQCSTFRVFGILAAVLLIIIPSATHHFKMSDIAKHWHDLFY